MCADGACEVKLRLVVGGLGDPPPLSTVGENPVVTSAPVIGVTEAGNAGAKPVTLSELVDGIVALSSLGTSAVMVSER